MTFPRYPSFHSSASSMQGEQADVVVVSLVRSNSEGRPGFLKEPERLNVMLSRARHGLIMIGSSSTLRAAKQPKARAHLGRLLEQLSHMGALHNGLPAVCQQHGTRITPELESPRAFLERAPHGGCCLPCNETLPCGHTCTLRCHAYDREHKHVACSELVHSYCPAGHLVVRRCSQPDAPCHTCVELRRMEEEERSQLEALVCADCIYHAVVPYVTSFSYCSAHVLAVPRMWPLVCSHVEHSVFQRNLPEPAGAQWHVAWSWQLPSDCPAGCWHSSCKGTHH